MEMGALIKIGHISIVYFLNHGSEETAKVLMTHYSHSKVVRKLAIPCKFIFPGKNALIQTLKTLLWEGEISFV